MRVAGWALFAAEGVARVEILIDGRSAGRAQLGLPRVYLQRPWRSPQALVADARARVGMRPAAPRRPWRSPEAFVSGFELWVGPSALSTGPDSARVEALVTGLRGSELSLATTAQLFREPAPRPAAAGERHEVVSARRVSSVPRRAVDRPRDGWRLLAFTHSLDAGGAQRYLFEQLRRLSRRRGFSCVVVAPSDGVWRSPLEQIGVEVRVGFAYPDAGITAYERAVAELAGWVERERFDVVLANSLEAFLGVDVADRLGLPSAWAIHESYELPVWWAIFHQGAEPYLYGRSRHALSTASALLFAAHSTRRLYVDHASATRMVTAPYGLELGEIDRFRRSHDELELRRRLGVRAGATVILSLGVFEPRKGQAVLARAYAEICRDRPDTHLVLVGERGSPYCRALRRYVDDSPLSERCTIVPVTMDAYAWHAIADLFVLASDVESCPIALLEAMAFETPVLASRVFGVPELITPDRDGFLYEPNDVAGLAETLDRVLSFDCGKRKVVGLAGARRVRERHDPQRYSARLDRVLRGLIESPTAPVRWDSEASPAG